MRTVIFKLINRCALTLYLYIGTTHHIYRGVIRNTQTCNEATKRSIITDIYGLHSVNLPPTRRVQRSVAFRYSIWKPHHKHQTIYTQYTKKRCSTAYSTGSTTTCMRVSTGKYVSVMRPHDSLEWNERTKKTTRFKRKNEASQIGRYCFKLKTPF